MARTTAQIIYSTRRTAGITSYWEESRAQSLVPRPTRCVPSPKPGPSQGMGGRSHQGPMPQRAHAIALGCMESMDRSRERHSDEASPPAQRNFAKRGDHHREANSVPSHGPRGDQATPCRAVLPVCSQSTTPGPGADGQAALRAPVHGPTAISWRRALWSRRRAGLM